MLGFNRPKTNIFLLSWQLGIKSLDLKLATKLLGIENLDPVNSFNLQHPFVASHNNRGLGRDGKLQQEVIIFVWKDDLTDWLR